VCSPQIPPIFPHREKMGERTRHRVLFPAPSPETRLAIERTLIHLSDAQDLSSQQTARARSATREGACAPRGFLPFRISSSRIDIGQ
jgi:hypothetical protein